MDPCIWWISDPNTAGFCRLLVLPSQVLGLGSSKPDPGWSLGIAQGLEGIRTDKAREPGPPKEDCVGSRKLGLPWNIFQIFRILCPLVCSQRLWSFCIAPQSFWLGILVARALRSTERSVATSMGIKHDTRGHTYIHTYLPTYIHTYLHTYNVHIYFFTCTYRYTHTLCMYIYIYIHVYT